MSSTLTTRSATTTTTTTAAIPAQRQRHGRRPSRRTTWVVAAVAAAAVAATGGTVAVLSSDDAPAGTVTSVRTDWSPSADAAESSHGFGPAAGRPLPVPRRAETSQLVHGSAGALRDAAGRPLQL